MKRYRNWLFQGGGVVTLEPGMRLVMARKSLHRLAMIGALTKQEQSAYYICFDDPKRAAWWLRN